MPSLVRRLAEVKVGQQAVFAADLSLTFRRLADVERGPGLVFAGYGRIAADATSSGQGLGISAAFLFRVLGCEENSSDDSRGWARSGLPRAVVLVLRVFVRCSRSLD